MPKYKVGDQLQLTGDTSGQKFKVVGIPGGSYVLQSDFPNTNAFYLPVNDVDSNPLWHKATNMTWILVGIVAILGLVMLQKR